MALRSDASREQRPRPVLSLATHAGAAHPYLSTMLYDADDNDDDDAEAVQHHSHIAGPMVSRDGCTVSRFNTWLVRDINRQQAEELREQQQQLLQRHAKSTDAYVERRRLRTQALRQQHLLAELIDAEAARKGREAVAVQGMRRRAPLRVAHAGADGARDVPADGADEPSHIAY